MSSPVSGGIGYGPLSVGPRWLAYSGSPVAISNSGCVRPQNLTPSASFPAFSSNGSLVAHYAKESTKQLAVGIVTLGDIGYKKLSRYCSEIRPDSNGSLQSVNSGCKGNGTSNGHSGDMDNVGMVIVKDIVSKSVIAQFWAHKSPISALCFDPSGTILVTASVQGHNINVFKIMPRHSNSLSASDAGPSHVHLYRLQRGFTNAVIQDISFSDDSSWIMISSSRGTSHLFAINPQGGPLNIQSYDTSLTSRNGGLGVMNNQAVQWPSSSGLQKPKEQSLCAAGPPITLTVVCRIRSGNAGWRGTVSGAAAAATGRISSHSGAIASSFCKCKGSALYVDGNRFKTKYHLLVFSPSGSMIQYALGTSTCQDSAVVSGSTPAYECALEVDARLVVEAIQKWNICQRHGRREPEDNIDMCGENGISDRSKIYPVEVKEENIDNPMLENVIMNVNSRPEEQHRLYISETELQTHKAETPLWAKQEIYFQSMVKEESILAEVIASRGEIDIERIPTRMIEARSKGLVPIFDFLPARNVQQTRTPTLDSKLNEQQLHQNSGMFANGRISDTSNCMTNSAGAVTESNSSIEGTVRNGHPTVNSTVNEQQLHRNSGMSENGRISDTSNCMTSFGGAGTEVNSRIDGTERNGHPTLDSKVIEQELHQNSGMSENGSISGTSNCMTNFSALTESNSSIEGTESNGHPGAAETNGFVNKNDNDSLKANTQHGIVNNGEQINMDAQLMLVNTDKEGLTKENHLEDKGNEFN